MPDPSVVSGSSVATEETSEGYAGAIQEISRQELLDALGEAIDKAAPGLKDAFLSAIADAIDGVDLRQLKRALASGDLDEALDAIPFDDLQSAIAGIAASGEKPGPLAAPYNAGVDLALGTLPAHVAVELDHSLIRSEAADWLTEHGADLAQALTGETKAGIRELLSSAMERGGQDVYDVGRDISRVLDAQTMAGFIGLNERQAVALDNYIDALAQTDRADMSDAAMQDAIDQRYQEMLDYRGEMIARTEASRAGNAGQNDVWNDAVDQGKLDGEAYEVEWVASPTACSAICADLDGLTRAIDGEYEDEDAGEGPPAHPSCNCSERLVAAEEEAA